MKELQSLLIRPREGFTAGIFGYHLIPPHNTF